MQQSREYTRKELADATGFSEANIKKYIALGLLPPGKGEKRWCRYDDRHVRRLRLIRAKYHDESRTLVEFRDGMTADPAFAFR